MFKPFKIGKGHSLTPRWSKAASNVTISSASQHPNWTCLYGAGLARAPVLARFAEISPQQKCFILCLYESRASPVRRDPAFAYPRSRLTGLIFLHTNSAARALSRADIVHNIDFKRALVHSLNFEAGWRRKRCREAAVENGLKRSIGGEWASKDKFKKKISFRSENSAWWKTALRVWFRNLANFSARHVGGQQIVETFSWWLIPLTDKVWILPECPHILNIGIIAKSVQVSSEFRSYLALKLKQRSASLWVIFGSDEGCIHLICRLFLTIRKVFWTFCDLNRQSIHWNYILLRNLEI